MKRFAVSYPLVFMMALELGFIGRSLGVCAMVVTLNACPHVPAFLVYGEDPRKETRLVRRGSYRGGERPSHHMRRDRPERRPL